jgi:hypothetical protein
LNTWAREYCSSNLNFSESALSVAEIDKSMD